MEVRHESGHVIDSVERLDGPIEKTKGLMMQEEGRALLVFDQDDFHGVWMPFMQFAIDIAFIDAENSIVSIERSAEPVSADPSTWKVYRPAKRCRYILEVEAGLLDDRGFSVGDTVAFRD